MRVSAVEVADYRVVDPDPKLFACSDPYSNPDPNQSPVLFETNTYVALNSYRFKSLPCLLDNVEPYGKIR